MRSSKLVIAATAWLLRRTLPRLKAVIDSVFQGRQLHELELADVRALLADAKAEPLLWEAKGVKIKPGEIRKQIWQGCHYRSISPPIGRYLDRRQKAPKGATTQYPCGIPPSSRRPTRWSRRAWRSSSPAASSRAWNSGGALGDGYGWQAPSAVLTAPVHESAGA
jgi:hypothetical protein